MESLLLRLLFFVETYDALLGQYPGLTCGLPADDPSGAGFGWGDVRIVLLAANSCDLNFVGGRLADNKSAFFIHAAAKHQTDITIDGKTGAANASPFVALLEIVQIGSPDGEHFEEIRRPWAGSEDEVMAGDGSPAVVTFFGAAYVHRLELGLFGFFDGADFFFEAKLDAEVFALFVEPFCEMAG